MKNLRKYLWQFFGLYLLGYAIFFPVIIEIDKVFNLHMHDLFLVVALSVAVPNYIAKKFVKNENRYFSDNEKKTMIKKSTIIAWVISDLPMALYFGYVIAVKFLVPAYEMPLFLASANLPLNSNLAIFLKIPIPFS